MYFFFLSKLGVPLLAICFKIILLNYEKKLVFLSQVARLNTLTMR